MKNNFQTSRHKGDLLAIAVLAFILATYVPSKGMQALCIIYASLALLRLVIEVMKQRNKVKVLQVDTMDFPPELKAKVDAVSAEIKSYMESTHPELSRKKCDDPHCPGCWGLDK